MVIHPVLLFCAHADTDRGNVPGPDVLAERLGADAEQGGGLFGLEEGRHGIRRLPGGRAEDLGDGLTPL